MRLSSLIRPIPLILSAIVATAPLAACSRNQGIYDSAHNDRHRWDAREETAYRRWEGERRFDHVVFDRRGASEQSDYWAWRHAHPN